MLAGIITESQYKEKIKEVDSMGKVGNSYPAPGAETEKLRDKAWDLYDKMLDLLEDNLYRNDDYIDGEINDSIPEDILRKIAGENTDYRGDGVGYILGSKFITEKELKKIIYILEKVNKLIETSGKDEIDFREYEFDSDKLEFYKKERYKNK
jgi:hypothetical protein